MRRQGEEREQQLLMERIEEDFGQLEREEEDKGRERRDMERKVREENDEKKRIMGLDNEERTLTAEKEETSVMEENIRNLETVKKENIVTDERTARDCGERDDRMREEREEEEGRDKRMMLRREEQEGLLELLKLSQRERRGRSRPAPDCLVGYLMYKN